MASIDAQIVSRFMEDPPFNTNWTNREIFLTSDFIKTTTPNLYTYYTYLDKHYLSGGKTMSGEWVDVILLKHWLTRQLEVEVLSKFYTKNKITNPTIIQDAIMDVLEMAKKLGGITRYVVRQLPSPDRSKPRFEWKAQLSGAINNVTISGTVEP